MDPALLIAITGLVTGVGGLVLSRRKDTEAAKNTAKDVASRAAEAAVEALNAALDRQQAEIEDLHLDVAELKKANAQLRGDNAVLLAEVRQCHADKSRLAERVRILEEQLA